MLVSGKQYILELLAKYLTHWISNASERNGGQILNPWLGDKVDSDIGSTQGQLWHRMAHVLESTTEYRQSEFETIPIVDTQRPGGHWFIKKNLKSKISCQTPFKERLLTDLLFLFFFFCAWNLKCWRRIKRLHQVHIGARALLDIKWIWFGYIDRPSQWGGRVYSTSSNYFYLPSRRLKEGGGGRQSVMFLYFFLHMYYSTCRA